MMRSWLLCVFAVLVLAAAASAAPPGSYSVSLDQASPSFGGQVTFTVSSSDFRPWLNVRCSQAGKLVYEEWHGIFPSYYTLPVFTLGPTTRWQSGAADCVALLGFWKRNGSFGVRASVSFLAVG